MPLLLASQEPPTQRLLLELQLLEPQLLHPQELPQVPALDRESLQQLAVLLLVPLVPRS